LRPVQLGVPVGRDEKAWKDWVTTSINKIAQASNDTLINDTSSSGNALATVVNAQANQFAYFTGPTTTAFANLTALTLLLLAQYTPVTFANLPSTPVEGMLIPVTNSNVNTWGTQITGTGAFHVLAYYDGSMWTVAAV